MVVCSMGAAWAACGVGCTGCYGWVGFVGKVWRVCGVRRVRCVVVCRGRGGWEVGVWDRVWDGVERLCGARSERGVRWMMDRMGECGWDRVRPCNASPIYICTYKV